MDSGPDHHPEEDQRGGREEAADDPARRREWTSRANRSPASLGPLPCGGAYSEGHQDQAKQGGPGEDPLVPHEAAVTPP